jgi:rhodanese-related sulfurtransferase
MTDERPPLSSPVFGDRPLSFDYPSPLMPDAPTDVARLTVAELKGRLDRGEPLAVLDVREEFERAYCALPVPPNVTDLHVPIGAIPARAEEIRRAAAGRRLVIYCHHGVRSLAAARWLATRGVAGVANLDGGIDAWSVEVDPGVPRY